MIVLRLKDRAFQLMLVTALLLSVTLLTIVSSTSAHASVRSTTIPSQRLPPTDSGNEGNSCINGYPYLLKQTTDYSEGFTFDLTLKVFAKYDNNNHFCGIFAQSVLTKIDHSYTIAGTVDLKIKDKYNTKNTLESLNNPVSDMNTVVDTKPILAKCVYVEVYTYPEEPHNTGTSLDNVCVPIFHHVQ